MISQKIHVSKVKGLLKTNRVIEPPVPVEAIAKNLGITLLRAPLSGDLSGLLYKQANSTVIGINSLHASVRQRFTVAHEIGHFLYHKESDVFVDRKFSIQFRDQRSSKAEVIDEIEANQFAAELLMPEEFVRKDLSGMTVDLANESLLSQFAERYQVSLQALVIRLSKLGFLPALK